jgi:hypothetical protein
MGKRGIRSEKGVAENRWGEPKDTNVNVTLTKSGREAVKKRLENAKTSLSEVLERWGRRYKVDDDSSLSPPVAPPGLPTLLQSLPHLSRSELARLAKAVIEILEGGRLTEENQEENQTLPKIGQLVAARRDVCIQQFSDCCIEPGRVDQIIQGEEPTLREIGVLPDCLDLEEEEFLEMFRREFRNGGNHQASQLYR